MARRFAFNEKNCAIPSTWCGDSETVPKTNNGETYYTRPGTKSECLKKGIGAGTFIERNKSLGSDSLQNIKYLGPKQEAALAEAGVKNLSGLVREMKRMSADEIDDFLRRVVGSDTKVKNSVLLYLYRHGMSDIPQCTKISPP